MDEMRMQPFGRLPAIPRPAPAPGRSGGRGCASGRAAGRAAKAPSARQKPARGRHGEQARAAPARLLVQIFREIVNRRLDLVVHRMALGVGRPSQRHDDEFEPGLLQAEQFLRDEGLRQARIALQDDDDLAPLVKSSARAFDHREMMTRARWSSQSPTISEIWPRPSSLRSGLLFDGRVAVRQRLQRRGEARPRPRPPPAAASRSGRVRRRGGRGSAAPGAARTRGTISAGLSKDRISQ